MRERKRKGKKKVAMKLKKKIANNGLIVFVDHRVLLLLPGKNCYGMYHFNLNVNGVTLILKNSVGACFLGGNKKGEEKKVFCLLLFHFVPLFIGEVWF